MYINLQEYNMNSKFEHQKGPLLKQKVDCQGVGAIVMQFLSFEWVLNDSLVSQMQKYQGSDGFIRQAGLKDFLINLRVLNGKYQQVL